MENAELLIVSIAEQCKEQILASIETDSELPAPLQRVHLTWMCDSISTQAEHWSPTKLHRWIGFVQCAMIANRILDLEEARTMLRVAKVAYGKTGDDLLDHLDPSKSFELDIGGEG